MSLAAEGIGTKHIYVCITMLKSSVSFNFQIVVSNVYLYRPVL